MEVERWKEEVVLNKTGQLRVVHFYLHYTNGKKELAVIGTKLGIDRMSYSIPGRFLRSLPPPFQPPNLMLTSRLEVFEWLSSLVVSRSCGPIDVESEEELTELQIPELNEKDGKCFELVETLIKDGKLDELKVDQCKVYLRKYGLRLSGNKGVLIGRIKEHLEIIDGGGEKKYPPTSFVVNCKGDACTGDVVMFERSPRPCGKREVAGRIVKESYGAAKKQHTFTIEVFWSKGGKPLPPLHPLLIKGRKLYSIKTMRQRWVDEEKRQKILQEKHSRGSVARSRKNSSHGKEIKKMARNGRMKENNREQILSDQKNQYLLHTNHMERQRILYANSLEMQYRLPQHHQQPMKRPLCPYYPKGKCFFGSRCKYLHESR